MLKIWQKNSKTYGAIMALAGLFVDWTCESQPSNWAFSWGPMKRQVEKKVSEATYYRQPHMLQRPHRTSTILK